MDTSTLIFIGTITIAFIFLRWLISPIPQSNEFAPVDSSLIHTSSRRRHVLESMIEVVKTIAPSLTREQIIFDLEKTGLVEVTVENYMRSNSLPFPTAEFIRAHGVSSGSSSSRVNPVNGVNEGNNVSTNSANINNTNDNNTNDNKTTKSSSVKAPNLLKRFGIGEDLTINADNELLAKKQEMVINARKRLEKMSN